MQQRNPRQTITLTTCDQTQLTNHPSAIVAERSQSCLNTMRYAIAAERTLLLPMEQRGSEDSTLSIGERVNAFLGSIPKRWRWSNGVGVLFSSFQLTVKEGGKSRLVH